MRLPGITCSSPDSPHPRPHGIEDRLQAAAGLGEGIFRSRRHLGIDLPGQQALSLQRLLDEDMRYRGAGRRDRQ